MKKHKYVFKGLTEYNNSPVTGSLIQYPDGTHIIMSPDNPYSFSLELEHGLYRHIVRGETVELLRTEDIEYKDDYSLPMQHSMYDTSHCSADCVTECARSRPSLQRYYTCADFSQVCAKYRQKSKPMNSSSVEEK